MIRVFLRGLLWSLILLSSLHAVWGQVSDFGVDVLIGHGLSPQMTVAGGVFYLAWRSPDYRDVLFSVSNDGGETWEPAVSAIPAQSPRGVFSTIAMNVDSNGAIYVLATYVWDPYVTQNDRDILFTKSVDGGISFFAPINVTPDTQTEADFFPSLTVDRHGSIFVTWTKDMDRNINTAVDRELRFTKSSDGGVSFAPDISLGHNGGDEASMDMDDSGVIYIAWSPRNFAKSLDRGDSFTTSILPITAPWSLDMTVNNPGSVVYLTYSDGYINFVKSDDSGETWGSPTRVSTSANQYYPRIAIDIAESIYVAWYDSNMQNILFAESHDSGSTFTPAMRISDAGGAHGGNGHADFLDTDEEANIGVTWRTYSNEVYVDSRITQLPAPVSVPEFGSTFIPLASSIVILYLLKATRDNKVRR